MSITVSVTYKIFLKKLYILLRLMGYEAQLDLEGDDFISLNCDKFILIFSKIENYASLSFYSNLDNNIIYPIPNNVVTYNNESIPLIISEISKNAFPLGDFIPTTFSSFLTSLITADNKTPRVYTDLTFKSMCHVLHRVDDELASTFDFTPILDIRSECLFNTVSQENYKVFIIRQSNRTCFEFYGKKFIPFLYSTNTYSSDYWRVIEPEFANEVIGENKDIKRIYTFLKDNDEFFPNGMNPKLAYLPIKRCGVKFNEFRVLYNYK